MSGAAGGRASPAGSEDVDDTLCQVCFEGWTEPTNEIVFCEGCDLAVHQGCYGVPVLPEGDEPCFCQPCDLSRPPRDIKCARFGARALRVLVAGWADSDRQSVRESEPGARIVYFTQLVYY